VVRSPWQRVRPNDSAEEAPAMTTMQIVLIVLLIALIAAFVVIRKKQNR
jgi:hypothetical protein